MYSSPFSYIDSRIQDSQKSESDNKSIEEYQKIKHIEASIDKSDDTEESKQNTNDSHEEQKSSFKETNVNNNCEPDCCSIIIPPYPG